ncbi:glycosyltransferase family 4 protein [Desulfosarcina ovata]|uniref:Glycosyl transferase family 1 n=1 Tax=Desulfosarcina ovata subsp. ovata TaxID=2752305 RepID=A0A5K8A589_9BACT|nr:glycosyltransferase family 4 protein [Desulfosarcina ovata]BBO87647.1 glycosyl transferase family 1 [Desulfosarcina ovata subsp. ovata]
MTIEKQLIHICNVIEEGRFGGPARRIVQVAKALKQHGVETIVVYPRYDSKILSQEVFKADISSNALVITRLSKEKQILAKYIFCFFIEIYCLWRFFRKNTFDLIHVNGSYQFKAAIAARLSGNPVVWHLNDTYAPSILKKVFHCVAPICADGFIIAGKRVFSYYIKGRSLAEKPVQEVHAPVDMTLFDPSNYSEHVRGKNEDVVIGTVSSVNPAKGLEYFVDTAIEVINRCPNVRFLIAGAILNSQKQYFEMIQRKLNNFSEAGKITFCGLIEDVPEFISKLDICLFSSVTEASPTSIWEAMAMAKPIVTTDVGSVNQHLKNGVSGFVVPVRDSNALANRTLDLINQPDLRKKFGKNARRYAVKYLGIDAAAQKHKEIYKIILEKNI